ncbi:MAG: ATP-binding protein [Planctomycetota bacterium]|nr:ATP-binding protein [Planctomycetota bacterium]
MHWSLSLFFGLGVGVVAAAATSRVLVRRSLARAQLAERRARDAQRMAEIGAMTGGLAHEIKNPLSTIALNAQLLAEGVDELPVAPEEKGRLQRRTSALTREVERLRGILSDFLEYAGELRLAVAPAELNTMVEELSDFFMPQTAQQGVRLRTDLWPAPVPIHADVKALKQAVLNLMINATQAMQGSPAGQARELILKTTVEPGVGGERPNRRSERREVSPAREAGPMAVLHVIDTGPGISPDKRQQIFQPYFTTKAGGTGLGLPTARRIVEAHEGRLEVISEVGRGTDFVIRLPLNAGEGSQEPAPTPQT